MNLARVFQNLFMANGSSSHSEQFGAKVQTGSAVPTLDPNSIQAGEAFTGNGWLDAVVSANKQPYLEDMNGLFVLAFRQIAYILQKGIPDWDPSTDYWTGNIVRASGTSQLYASLIDNNTGNALPSQTNNGFWQYLNPQADPSGIVKPYAGIMSTPTSVPGYLLCDGSSYVQSSYVNLYTALTGAGWDTFNGAASPGVGNFRVPDLRGLTLMGVGHGTGFSARTLAQLIGEETHTLVVGEIPSGLTVVNPTLVGSVQGHSVGLAVAAGGNGPFLQTDSGSYPISASASGGTAGGGGGAHNNMQPSAGVNYLIKI